MRRNSFPDSLLRLLNCWNGTFCRVRPYQLLQVRIYYEIVDHLLLSVFYYNGFSYVFCAGIQLLKLIFALKMDHRRTATIT